MRSPNASNASACSCACFPGIGAIAPDSADGFIISFWSCVAGGGVAGGVGGVAACFLLSNDPICNWLLYFFRIPSL